MLKLYRKSDHKVPRLNRKDRAQLEYVLSVRCKVQRHDIVNFILDDYNKLPILTPAEVKNRPGRILDNGEAGWEIPITEYKLKTSQQSSANSITAWIKSNMADLISASDFSIVVE